MESKSGNREGSGKVAKLREGFGGDDNGEAGQRGKAVKPKKRQPRKRQILDRLENKSGNKEAVGVSVTARRS